MEALAPVNKIKIMIEFKNGWKSNAKQDDKCIIEIRFGRFTLIEIYSDMSTKRFVIGLCNFFIHN